MTNRALPLLLSVTLATMVLAGCSRTAMPGAASATKAQALKAKGAVEDAMEFQASARKAADLIHTSPAWKNARLVSIEGHGFDQSGQMVSLLGSYWVFKFWANAVDEEGVMDQKVTRADVVLHIEGGHEIVDGGEEQQVALVRVIDPTTLAAPTKIVPFSVAMGLKVNPAGPAFNYFDLTYNSFYANPSAAQTDVVDVTSWYQQSTFDGFRLPARPELLPATPPKRMSQAELARETAERQHR